jgi:hypothetical protein
MPCHYQAHTLTQQLAAALVARKTIEEYSQRWVSTAVPQRSEKAYYIPVASDQSWRHRQASFRCWRWIWGATKASGLDLTFTLDRRLNHQMIIYFGSESTTQQCKRLRIEYQTWKTFGSRKFVFFDIFGLASLMANALKVGLSLKRSRRSQR